MKNIKNLALFIMVVFISYAANADTNTIKPVARIGNSIITNLELDKKMELILLRSKQEINDNNKNLIKKNTLNQLINEKIHWQAGKNFIPAIKEYELNEQKRLVMQKLNIPNDLIYEALIIDEIKSSISWNTIIQHHIQAISNVSEVEINNYIKKILSNKDQREFLIQLIFLPGNKSDTAKLANKIHYQIENQSTTFEEAVSNFSKLTISDNSGSIGWITLNSLPYELHQAVNNMDINMLSKPIKSSDGHYILKLNNKRNISIPTYMLVTYKISGKNDTQTREKLNYIKKYAKNCNDFQNMALDNKNIQWEQKTINQKSNLYSIINNVNIDSATPILTQNNNLELYVLCGYKKPQGFDSFKEQIKKLIVQNKQIKELSNISRELQLKADIEIYDH